MKVISHPPHRVSPARQRVRPAGVTPLVLGGGTAGPAVGESTRNRIVTPRGGKVAQLVQSLEVPCLSL